MILHPSQALGAPVAASIPVEPLTDNPTTCTGAPLKTSLEVQTYQDPEHLSVKDAEYPETTKCDLEVFNPVLCKPDHSRNRCAVGPQPRAQRPPVSRLRSLSLDSMGHGDLPRRLHDQP